MEATTLSRPEALATQKVAIRPLRLGGDRNALTVDLEDWYHVCNAEEYLPASRWDAYEERVTRNTKKILDLLGRHGVRVTFFILGYIARRHPGIVKEVARAGHEVATHGYFHKRVHKMTPEAFRKDLRDSVSAISDVVSSPVIGFRAPMWSINSRTTWALEILREEGFLYDSSVSPITFLSGRDFPVHPFDWETPSGPIREFPASTMRCFWENLPYAGGLPLRMTPYWYLLSKIGRTNRQGHPAMVYVHPWEVDPLQPRIRAPLKSRLRHYIGLDGTARKLANLMDRFRFATMSEVIATVNGIPELALS